MPQHANTRSKWVETPLELVEGGSGAAPGDSGDISSGKGIELE